MVRWVGISEWQDLSNSVVCGKHFKHTGSEHFQRSALLGISPSLSHIHSLSSLSAIAGVSEHRRAMNFSKLYE